MIQFVIFATLFQALLVAAAPVIVYKTVEKDPVYVTQYVDGASAGDSDVGFTTLWSNAVSYTSTLWPVTTSTSEYSTVLPETQAPAAAATTTSPEAVQDATHSHADGVVVITSVKTIVSTQGGGNAATVPTVTTSTSSSPVVVATSTSTSTTSAPVVITTTSEATTTSSQSSTTAINGPAITTLPKYLVYSPYNNDQSCKNADTVKSDLQNLANKGVKRIRMYATDCNSLDTVQPAAEALGIRIVQGLWIGTAGTGNALSQLNDLISAANGDWSNYDSIIVGNEDVTNGYISASTLLDLTKQVRSQLQAAGFYGDVIIAETTTAYINNPDVLCDSSFPFIGLNAHSYFAQSFSAQQAGEFVADQMSIVQGKCGRRDIWISETGYPHQGNTNGANVPSKQNQADAVNAILDHLGGDCVVLAQYDDMWKQPGQYNVEQYFGMLDILV